jgi:D-alanyl-D-alanine carboxypeptidase/D-alanyl-D-alanine-endopeptidase (penicillin-binding protein 4)
MQNTELPEFFLSKRFESKTDKPAIIKLSGKNHFIATLAGNESVIKQSVPFEPMGLDAAMITLRNISYRGVYRRKLKDADVKLLKPLYSQSTDSVIKEMLLRSDNFFAEQLLLQSAGKAIGRFNERMMIDTLLANELADLPDKPRWVDGSGLSRYNLFTPRTQTFLLKKMIDSFGLDYVKEMLAHNGEGTLKSFLSDLPPVIYAKTGTLSNNFCLSGLLITKSKKRLLFSVMINHTMAKPSYMRACVERYLKTVLEQM